MIADDMPPCPGWTERPGLFSDVSDSPMRCPQPRGRVALPNASRSARLSKRKRAERRAVRREDDAPPPPPGGLVWQMRILRVLASGIPVLFLGFAWIALSIGLRDRSLAVESKTWPTAPGVVV